MADVSYADVIRTVNGLLKTKYPEITRYGNDTVDKAVPPYFFVECVPVGAEHVTKNMLHKGCSVLITYMQRTPAQMDNLEKAEEIFGQGYNTANEVLNQLLEEKGKIWK